MGKSRNRNNYHQKASHYAPFTYSKDEWKDDKDNKIVVKIEPAKSGQGSTQVLKLEEKIFVLTPNSSPEKLVLWWMEI